MPWSMRVSVVGIVVGACVLPPWLLAMSGCYGGVPTSGPNNPGADSGFLDASTPFDSSGSAIEAGDTGSTGTCAFDAGASPCSTLAPPCTAVAITESAAALPTFTGGTIAPGTYVLTSATAYTAGNCSGTLLYPALAITDEFLAGGSFQSADDVQGVGGATVGSTASGTYTTSASTLTVDQTCAPNGPVTSSFPYTATATQLTYNSTRAPGGVIEQSDGGFCAQLVLVLTKM